MTTFPAPAPVDRFARPLRSLRLSVTDRCNLRCTYCMPEVDYVWLPRSDVLDFDELSRLVAVFTTLGVDRVRITGGEPLLRRDLDRLIGRIAVQPGVRDVSMTTNGVLLEAHAEALRAAGLDRVTISLDTLRADRFQALTGSDALDQVLAAIRHATGVGFAGLKLNTVLMRGSNDDEVDDLLAFGNEVGAEVRFIEYMDVGGATRWASGKVLPRAELLAGLAVRHGSVAPIVESEWSPADRYRLPDGQVFGVIASTSEPFCRTCDRSRLTADGMFFTCLYARGGIQLRDALRNGATDDELRALLARTWTERTDRGAEERLALLESRSALADADEMRAHPHLEMHTRGG